VPFKEILEHPGLPSAATMAYDLARITGLSDAALTSKMDIYAELLKKRHNSGKQRGKKWPRDLFENKSHWRRLSREEMASALVVEYVKCAIGKSRSEAVGELLGLRR
jgi:IS1 family transposase